MQANLKERSVSNKLMGMTGCDFQLETKTCLCSSWLNICPKNRQIVAWLQLSGVWCMSALCVPPPQQCVLPPAPGHRHFVCKELSRAFQRSGATGASNESKLVAGQEEIPCSDELNGHLINWNHVSRDSERRRIQNGELYWGKPQWGKGPTAKATCLTPWHFLMDITLLTDCRSTPWEQVQTMPSCICYNAKTFPLIFVVIFEQVNMPLSLQAGKS